MATLIHYAPALRYVHIQALLLADAYSPDAADRLRVALKRHLDLLAEWCDAFNGGDQHRACQDIHEQCAALLSLLREVAISARPVKEEAVTQLARLWRDNQDERGATIKMRRSGRMEDDCRWPGALQAD